MASISGIANTGGRRIFVARLAPYTKKADLMKLFAAFGAEHAVVRRKSSGNTAFVTFKTPEGARQALRTAATQPFVCHKRTLLVKAADSWHELQLIAPKPHIDPFPGLKFVEPHPLPIVCISLIAGFLPFADRAHMEQVSRRWREGTRDSYRGITHLDLEDWRWPDTWAGKEVSLDAFYWAVLRCGPFLRSVILNDTRAAANLRSQAITIVAKSCPKLEILDITEVLISPAALREIAENIKTLQELRIGSCQGMTEPHLYWVFAANPGLRKFKAVRNDLRGKSLRQLSKSLHSLIISETCILPEMLSSALNSFEQLHTFELYHCPNLTDDSILVTLVNHPHLGKSMRKLSFNFCLFEPNENLPDGDDDEDQGEVGNFAELGLGPARIAWDLPSVYRHLTDLSLIFCGWVDATLLENIGEHIKGLKRLNISGCTNIRGEFALDPLANLEECTELVMNNLYPEVGGYSLFMMPALERLECRDNPGIHSEHICGILRQNLRITHIDVEGCQNVGRAVVTCAYEVLRMRSGKLNLSLGATSACHHRQDRANVNLSITYQRHFEPIF